METKSKAKYIEVWQEQIGTLMPLASTSDLEASAEIQEHIARLKALVLIVAESKNLS